MDSLFDLPPELDTPAFRAAWGEWCQHRIEIRKRMTPTATRKQLVKLAAWGVARAIAAIEHSIEREWRGIYEDTRQAKAAPTGSSAPSFGEAWQQALKAACYDGGSGTIQEKAASVKATFASLHPLVRTALEQFTVRRLRNTRDDQMGMAMAQFRQLYEGLTAAKPPRLYREAT